MLISGRDSWKSFLRETLDDDKLEAIRAAERTGRPLGSDAFVRRLEKRLDRSLIKRKPGPKPADDAHQRDLL